MSRREKRIAQLLRLPPEMPYREVAAILEDLGWTERGQVGSHHQWTKPGERTRTIAEHHGSVKVEVLEDIKALLEQEGWR